MSDQLALLTEQDARALTRRIAEGMERVWADVVEAYQRRADKALGYSSWDEYCRDEFRTMRLRLPAEDRAIAVASLRAEGLSTRAIAAATGTSKGAVDRALAGAPTGAPVPVTGQDGKSYAASRPAPARPAPAPMPPPQDVPPPESWPQQRPAQVHDELAARREQGDAALAEVDRQRQATAEFNAATAHLVPKADAERPYGLAAIRVGRAIEALPLDMDPGELAACLPHISAHHLDQLPAAVDWMSRLVTARREAAS